MGCWNETCGISNLPIRTNERAVMILLRNSPYVSYEETTCIYPDSIWSPVGFPIFGNYNEYGGLDNAETHPWNCELIKQHEQESSNADRDITIDGYEINIDFPNVMFIHEELYNSIIDEVGNRIPARHTKTYKECLREYILEKTNQYNMKVVQKNVFVYGNDLTNPASIFMCNKFRQSDNQAEKDSAIENLINCIILYTALTLMRKGYCTQSGAGSQDCETALHLIVAKFITNYAQKMKEEFTEYDIDDEESESSDYGYQESIFFFK